jgi:hypothetical protein
MSSNIMKLQEGFELWGILTKTFLNSCEITLYGKWPILLHQLACLHVIGVQMFGIERSWFMLAPRLAHLNLNGGL